MPSLPAFPASTAVAVVIPACLRQHLHYWPLPVHFPAASHVRRRYRVPGSPEFTVMNATLSP